MIETIQQRYSNENSSADNEQTDKRSDGVKMIITDVEYNLSMGGRVVIDE